MLITFKIVQMCKHLLELTANAQNVFHQPSFTLSTNSKTWYSLVLQKIFYCLFQCNF